MQHVCIEGASSAHCAHKRTDVQLMLSLHELTYTLESQEAEGVQKCVIDTHAASMGGSMALLSWVGLWADSQGLSHLLRRRERARFGEICC